MYGSVPCVVHAYQTRVQLMNYHVADLNPLSSIISVVFEANLQARH